VIAVASLSWAASNGMGVTLIFTPGLRASNSLASVGSLSPSPPMAQTVMVPVALPELTVAALSAGVAAFSVDRPQADRPIAAVRASATTAVTLVLRFIVLLLGRGRARMR